MLKALMPLLALALFACASSPALRSYDLGKPRVELDATPFFAQAAYQCGPAALATVLGASGLPVTPDELVPQVYLPSRKGSLQPEMIAVTRRYQRVPYVLQADLSTLLAELHAGNPVLVLQNLGLAMWPQWHYAVVIGYDVASDRVLLRSGTNPRLEMSRRRFQATWERADRWALVVADPAHPPVTASDHAWIRAASAFESLSQPQPAAQAYMAATRRWPEQPLGWQALANARYAQGDLLAAEHALRQALQLERSAATHNNLAQVLLQRGCVTQALAEIDRADDADDAADFATELAQTRAAIAHHPNPDRHPETAACDDQPRQNAGLVVGSH